MKIALIGRGSQSIPPRGAGAIEIVIDAFRTGLEKRGAEVGIFNIADAGEIVAQVNAFAPDFVHCHWDEHIEALARLACPRKAITPYHAYQDQVWRFKGYFRRVNRPLVAASDVFIFALSQSIADVYLGQGVPGQRVRVMPNGVDWDGIRFSPTALRADRSLCLGEISARRRQSTVQAWDIDIDFIGPIGGDAIKSGFDPAMRSYLGQWTRDEVRERLTEYPNLVLLSDGEAHPLVCMEALSAGLGLVISEWAAANLDLSMPFIDVVPEARINDRAYIGATIERNRLTSLAMRDEIRAYAKSLDWAPRIDEYWRIVSEIVETAAVLPRALEPSARKKVAIVTTATGPSYEAFFPEFEASVFDVLGAEIDPTIYCLTDRPVPSTARTKITPVKHLDWPFASLMRFHPLNNLASELKAYDYVLAMDADMIVRRPFEAEIFDENFVAVLHPGFFASVRKSTFEDDPESEAYVPPERRRNYVQACFFGAKPVQFAYLAKFLSDMVARDLARGSVPVWHDESYLNWFFANHAFKALSPAYACPEGSKLRVAPFVVHRLKRNGAIRSADDMLDWKDALDPVGQDSLYRQLYLRSHEKTQRLNRKISRPPIAFAAAASALRRLFRKHKLRPRS